MGRVSGSGGGRKPNNSEWGQRHPGGLRKSVPAYVLGLHGAQVSLAAAAVERRVGIEHFVPASGERQADAKVVVDHWREIGDARDSRVAVRVITNEGDDVLVCVAGVYPLEALRAVIQLEERGRVAIAST